jgi:hypothetical protein
MGCVVLPRLQAQPERVFGVSAGLQAQLRQKSKKIGPYRLQDLHKKLSN